MDARHALPLDVEPGSEATVDFGAARPARLKGQLQLNAPGPADEEGGSDQQQTPSTRPTQLQELLVELSSDTATYRTLTNARGAFGFTGLLQWLGGGAALAFGMCILREIVNPQRPTLLQKVAQAGINALFSVAMAAVILRWWTVNEYELVVATGISGYLGSEWVWGRLQSLVRIAEGGRGA